MAHPTTTQPAAGTQSEGNVILMAGLALVIALAGYLGQGAMMGHAAPHDPQHEGPNVVHGSLGGVATASPEASQIALAVLQEGGNAFDALVAASFAVSVTRPQSTGIGGGGFVVYHQAEDGQQGAYDGREIAPASAGRDMYLDAQGNVSPRASLDGKKAGGVPGLVRMLHRIHIEHGSGMSWARLVEPSIALARDGFVVTDQLADSIANRSEVLARYPSSAAVFLPGGHAPKAGDVLVQKHLSASLIQIRNDPDAFYTGGLAALIANGVPAFERKDLETYRVRVPAPIVGEYRGHRVISMPPPSSGGVHLVQMLNIISQHSQALGSLQWHGADHIHLLTEAMRRAYADRSEHLGDPYHEPEFGSVGSKIPVEELTSLAYAKVLYGGIDMRRATPSSAVAPGVLEPYESEHTTHISIVDSEGNAVASTQTINTGMGSGYVIPATGILLNNEMDDFAAQPGAANYFGLVQGEKNAIVPGRRPLSSMSPTIVLNADGSVRLVVGSPGGPKIITATMQVLINVIDFKLPLEEAVAAPRMHHQWLYKGRDEVFLDEGFSQRTTHELTQRGHLLRVGATKLGNVQAVEVQADGTRVSVSDPRGTGRPAGY